MAKTVKLSAKERRQIEMQEEQLKKELFKKNLHLNLLKVIAQATEMNVNFKLIEEDNDLVFYLSLSRFEHLDINSYDYATFSLSHGDEFQFDYLLNVFENIKKKEEEARILEDKKVAARLKAKTLLSDEERKLLNINI